MKIKLGDFDERGRYLTETEQEYNIISRKVGKYFAVHLTVENGRKKKKRFTLSHVPTGMAIVSNLHGERPAKLIASALSALPMPWEETSVIKLQGAALSLPVELRSWLYQMAEVA